MSGSEMRPAASPGPAPSVEQLRLIVENVTDIVWLARIEGLAELTRGGSPGQVDFDPDALLNRFQCTWVSPSVERVLGYRVDEMMRLHPRDFVTAAAYEAIRHRFAVALKAVLEDPDYVAGGPIELEHVTKDGRSCWCEQSVRFLRGKDGAPVGILGVARDVTERKRAERAIRGEQEKLRQLLEFQERERRMMAFEIHDGFVQLATGALMHFQAFGASRDEDPQQARQSFERGLQLLASSVDEARRLIGGLQPPVLDESGVVAAVEHLLGQIESRGGPEGEFEHDLGEMRLPRELETTIFRIVQEAVHNAHRHSESPRLRVRLGAEHGQVLIEVEDWGVGFDPGAVDESRFGLRGIRERARLLSGTAEVDSRLGEGTRIVVRLPLWPETGAED